MHRPNHKAFLFGWVFTTIGFMFAIAGAAMSRVGRVAQRVAPRFVYIGKQVYLPREEKTMYKRKNFFMIQDDPLVPSRAKPSPLAAHRMISYRARMIDLYAQLK